MPHLHPAINIVANRRVTPERLIKLRLTFAQLKEPRAGTPPVGLIERRN
jgi:hypothetical protein